MYVLFIIFPKLWALFINLCLRDTPIDCLGGIDNSFLLLPFFANIVKQSLKHVHKML